MRRPNGVVALWCALMPVALLGGCGGGGSATLTPTTPVFSGVTLPTAVFRLPDGRPAILQLTRNGSALAGAVRVVGDATTQSALPAGTYPVTGNFAAPGGFSLAGRAAGTDISLSGALPSGGSDGSFNFTAGSFSNSGTLPAQGLVPATSSYVSFGDLSFSDFTARGPRNQLSDYPFDLAPITPDGAGAFNTVATPSINNGVIQFNVGSDSTTQYLRVQGARTDAANPRRNARVTVEITPILAGQPQLLSAGRSFDLKPPFGASSHGATVTVSLGGFNYISSAGTLTLDSITSESASFTLRDVKVASNSFPSNSGDLSGFPNDGQPISSFVINGRFSAFGLPTLVRDQPR